MSIIEKLELDPFPVFSPYRAGLVIVESVKLNKFLEQYHELVEILIKYFNANENRGSVYDMEVLEVLLDITGKSWDEIEALL